jgi:hypothetical protein
VDHWADGSKAIFPSFHAFFRLSTVTTAGADVQEAEEESPILGMNSSSPNSRKLYNERRLYIRLCASSEILLALEPLARRRCCYLKYKSNERVNWDISTLKPLFTDFFRVHYVTLAGFNSHFLFFPFVCSFNYYSAGL